MLTLFYFFWISLTITGCLILSLSRAHKQKFPLKLYFNVSGALLFIIPLGARLLHVFYEEPSYYMESPLRILEIWRGGFVYYGGLILSILYFILYFSKSREKTFWETADFFAPVFCFGTGIGRWACFIQGCCFGHELNAFWSVEGRHPTQLYIFFWEMMLFFILLKLEKRRRKSGTLFLLWLSASAFGRFFVEFYRDDFRGHMMMGLSISQIISLTIIALSAAAFYFKSKT